MKKIVGFILVVALFSVLFASPVSQQDILMTAENWLEIQSSSDFTVSSYEIVADSLNTPLLYKINFLPEGFVIISADDSSIPILGYSLNGTIAGSSNPAREDLINNYTDQLIDIKTNNRSNSTTLAIWNSILNRTISTRTEHDTGLNTQWHQDSPYNMYCPFDPSSSQRCKVGCVSTAASQIVNYFKHWNYVFSYSADHYTSSTTALTTHIDEDATAHQFPNFSTLNNYMSTLASKYANNTPLNNNDMAALNFANGILVHMQYSPSASSAGTGYQVFIKNNYDYRHAYKSSYSDAVWENMIISQLDANRPIQYIARRYTGNGTSGHAFILCGYRTSTSSTTEYKVNWGWGGTYDEYYAINALNPGSYEYNLYHEMLYHIAPKGTLTQSVEFTRYPEYSGLRLRAVDSDGDEQIFNSDSNGNFNVQLAIGTYNFTIFHTSGNYTSYDFNNRIIHTGNNVLSSLPIKLVYTPMIIVPVDVTVIQEAIDLVQNNGTVLIQNGTYYVSGLSWNNKHLKLQGQSMSGVILQNSDTFTQAIRLDWSGINNLDIIKYINFNNCILHDDDEGRGAAIALYNGASPQIISCNFNYNRVENSYVFEYPNYTGVGGAVYIGGTVNQTTTPIFTTCNFNNNFTSNANGGGAVAINGRVSFQTCNFNNNRTDYTVSYPPYPVTEHAGGAIIIYTNANNGDILFNGCQFNNNKGVNEAHDVFVYNCDNLNNLSFIDCIFNWGGTQYYNTLPSIRILKDGQSYAQNMHTNIIFRGNKFASTNQGAIYFSDYQGKNKIELTRNIIANNTHTTSNSNGYGFFLRYHGGTPVNQNYFKYNNNTVSNIQGYGVVLKEGDHYTINNSIFENCTSAGISWAQGNPSWITESLTVKYSLFSDSSPKYDFGGNSNHPLIENSVLSVQAMNLDVYYTPIWNTVVKSPCIDNGNPDSDGDSSLWYDDADDLDSDNTQLDIGAKPNLDGHLHEIHRITGGNLNTRWISFPGIFNPANPNHIPSEFTDINYVFNDYHNNHFLIPPPEHILDRIGSKTNDDNYFAYPGNVPSHNVMSQYGYKVTLRSEIQEEQILEYQGYRPGSTNNAGMWVDELGRYTKELFIRHRDEGVNCFYDPVMQHWIREIYLGYYMPEALKPFDALQPILNDIIAIYAENWCMVRLPQVGYTGYTNNWLGVPYDENAGENPAINPGEMVSIYYIGDYDVEFNWGGTNPNPPFVDAYYREMPSHFGYEEQPEYVPIFITLNLDQYEEGNKPVEIAIFVNEECKGAAVIKEEQVQLNAYILNDPTIELKDLQFRMYFPSKAANSVVNDYKVMDYSMGRYETRKVKVADCGRFLQVSIDDHVEPPTLTSLMNNYPNPFKSSTTIKYDLAKSGKTKLEIFNVKGQLVKKLVDSDYKAGSYVIEWNGKDDKGKSVSSGLYFYTLTSNGKSITNKMLMLK